MTPQDQKALLKLADDIDGIATGNFLEEALPSSLIGVDGAPTIKRRIRNALPSPGQLHDTADAMRSLTEDTVEANAEVERLEDQLNSITWLLSLLSDDEIQDLRARGDRAIAKAAKQAAADDRADQLLKDAKAHMATAGKVLDSLGTPDPEQVIQILHLRTQAG